MNWKYLLLFLLGLIFGISGYYIYDQKKVYEPSPTPPVTSITASTPSSIVPPTTFTTSTTSSEGNLSFKQKCLNSSGQWDDEYKECNKIDEDTCSRIGGISTCGHPSCDDQGRCLLICKITCKSQ